LAAAALAAAVSQANWRFTLCGNDRPVHSAAFSPDGSRIVTASDDKTARIWDAATAKEIAVLRGHEERSRMAEDDHAALHRERPRGMAYQEPQGRSHHPRGVL
jgi:hypothetical protein